jgi:isopentenyl diphosphate isomerase/L-lactate dehydrogenase-like FMN-dependent dehydrogenase
MLRDFRYRWRAPSRPLTVEDWRRRARKRLPDMVWAYVENGADDERTLRRNIDAFADWSLRQRVMSAGARVDLAAEVLGTRLAMPVLLAPTGLAGAVHWTGDLGIAQAAEAMGTRLVLSSASTYSIEEVAAGTTKPHWFQLYPWRNAGLIDSLVGRAGDAGYSTLVVTVDVPVYGNRLRETRTGMGIPPTISPAQAWSAVRRPPWLFHLLREQRIGLKNLEPVGSAAGSVESFAVQSENLGAGLDWRDLEHIRARWAGPLLVKGILDADDAERAVEVGADGVVVSNHGGRQLNATLSSLEVLPSVVERVAHRVPVLMDGGVRTGSDVVVALALGATACLVGRPVLYGLGGGGSDGARDVLRILREEMERTLALMGVSGVAAIDRGCVFRAGPGGTGVSSDMAAHRA